MDDQLSLTTAVNLRLTRDRSYAGEVEVGDFPPLHCRSYGYPGEMPTTVYFDFGE